MSQPDVKNTTYNLKYGTAKIPLVLQPNIKRIEGNQPPFELNKSKFKNELEVLLPANITTSTTVAIVVADKSRTCGYQTLLPWITDLLLSKGINKEEITFYIAYGTHGKQSDTESHQVYGDIFYDYKFVHHKSNKVELFECYETTKRGTTVLVRKDVFKNDVVITVGAISYHYFAGYGGGRKLIFPGLAAYRSIQHNHKLYLDGDNKTLNNKCQPGILEDNPVAEDLKEIYRMFPPFIMIHGILDSNGSIQQAIIGNTYDSFLKACEIHNQCYGVRTTESYDMVLTSAGGFPKDINFIQAHKAIHHAAMFVKSGGKLIVFAECRDKIGSESFLKHFDFNYNRAFDAIYHNYAGNGGTALSLMEKTKRIKIYLVTELEQYLCEKLHLKKVEPKKVMSMVKNHQGSLAIISNASTIIPQKIP